MFNERRFNARFRPLRGLRISQSRITFDINKDITPFPSPAGSSYFSMHKPHLLAAEFVGVSVPCGVFVFLNHTAQASS